MEFRTLSCRLEPLFHQFFGSVGLFLTRHRGVVSFLVTVILVALSFGLFALDVESDTIDLTISRRGRIHQEKKYFENNFGSISPDLSSFIITPKTGHTLLTKESLEEVLDLQNWIRTFSFEASPGLNISLEQFCFKSVDNEAHEPCYQASILDCFAEGDVFNIGGERNADYKDFYSTRMSFRELSFHTEFNVTFVREQCRAWTGTQTSLPLIMSEVVYKEGGGGGGGDQIDSIGAFQIAFGTKSAEVLAETGLEYVDWMPVSRTEESGEAVCPDVSKCEPCADALSASRFLRAGCIVGSSDQPKSCCEEMKLLRRSPCVEIIFERQPTAGDVANPLFTACGIDLVQLAPRYLEEEKEFVDDDICNCLKTQNSSDCVQSIAAMSGSYPDLNTVFLGEDGSFTNRDAFARYLVEAFDCESKNIAPVASLPEVCTCLTNKDSPECKTAAMAFAMENPDYIEVFTAASQGDLAAQQQIAILLSTLCKEDNESSSQTPKVANLTTSTSESIEYKASPRIIRELTPSVKEAENLLHSWELAWKESIKTKIEKYKTIDVTWISSRSLNDAAKDAAGAQIHLIALGYLLVLLYILSYFAFQYKNGRIVRSTVPPGPLAAALCFLCVLLGVCATFGVISLFSLSSLKASAITMQIVPLLTVGLGVNDLFVLVSALLSVLDRKKELEKIMFEAMSIGGTSITLSSAANATAFALGMLSPVPIVMWFSFQMMIGVVVAYLVSMIIIPTILASATEKWLKNTPDQIQESHEIQSKSPISPSEPKTPQEISDLVPIAVQCPSRRWKVVLVFILIGYLAWLAVSIVGITKLDQGLNFSEAVKKDSDLYDYLLNKEKYFQSYSINLVFSGDQDYSNPDIFAAARKAEYQFISDGYKTDKTAGVLSWFDYYTQYTEAKVCSNEICLTEVNWYYDDLSSDAFGNPNKNLCSTTQSELECESVCRNYCPQGPITTKYKCELSQDKRSCYCPWRPVLKPYLFYESPTGFDSNIGSYWTDFLTNTSIGLASRNLINFNKATQTKKNSYGIPQSTRSLAYVNDMLSTSERLKHIKQSRSILDKTQVDVYAFDYVVYALGDQYENLGLRTITAVGISLALACLVMIPLIASCLTAVLLVICIGSGIVLSAGTIHWLALKLNYASYVSLIVAVGLTLEFCAHIARDFMLAEGDRMTRSRHALKTMGIAVLNGGITTLLGLLPVALSSYGYFQKYYFIQYFVVVSVGLLTGLIFLPLVLSLFGPPSFMSTFTNKTNNEKIDQEFSVL
eukprot:g169.t1